MSIVLVTGSAGLIGSETSKFFHEKGFQVLGIDNNFREYFFGESASTKKMVYYLEEHLRDYFHHDIDIRDSEKINKLFHQYGKNISCVVHTAAQPSHDWAAEEPKTDFSINATGTMNLLEATRIYCPDATFIFTSTNKVYGDTPNNLPLEEHHSRFKLSNWHPMFEYGIDESMSIDQSTHSLFGVSKIAADLMTQEYGRYFGMNTGIFRGGCLTGPAHSGVELHGFLSYLVQCFLSGKHYTIYGYGGKQVRDNIHSKDLVSAFWEFYQNPRKGEVYNIGGSYHSNCSVLEAIHIVEYMTGKELNYTCDPRPRHGDHQWYISDIRKFQKHYPNWKYTYTIGEIIKEIIEAKNEK